MTRSRYGQMFSCMAAILIFHCQLDIITCLELQQQQTSLFSWFFGGNNKNELDDKGGKDVQQKIQSKSFMKEQNDELNKIIFNVTEYTDASLYQLTVLANQVHQQRVEHFSKSSKQVIEDDFKSWLANKDKTTGGHQLTSNSISKSVSTKAQDLIKDYLKRLHTNLVHFFDTAHQEMTVRLVEAVYGHQYSILTQWEASRVEYGYLGISTWVTVDELERWLSEYTPNPEDGVHYQDGNIMSIVKEQNKNKQEKWLREQKFETYSLLMASAISSYKVFLTENTKLVWNYLLNRAISELHQYYLQILQQAQDGTLM